jgi:hypothetical protein
MATVWKAMFTPVSGQEPAEYHIIADDVGEAARKAWRIDTAVAIPAEHAGRFRLLIERVAPVNEEPAAGGAA